MNSAHDISFAAEKEVVVIDGRREFTAHVNPESGLTTFLAGGYADAQSPAHLQVSEAANLFGQFVMLRHHPATRTLTVLTDRFGHYPLYMATSGGQTPNRLLLATDISTLTKQFETSAPLDLDATSDILAFNVPLGRSTLSNRVTSLGGGQELVIDLDTLAVRSQRLWNPIALLAQADLSFESVKDRLVDLYLEGIKLATTKAASVGVTLSGGADSRCLLAGSLDVGKPTVVYSTGVPGSRALAYAHGMAKLCGVPENPHPLDDAFVTRLPALMQESGLLMQGMSFSSELEAMWLRQHVAPQGVLLHGAFAELYKIGKMHNFHYDADIAGLSGGTVAARLWTRFSGRYALRLQGFNKPLAKEIGERARQRLSDKVTAYQRELDTAGVLQMIYIDEFLGKVAKASWHMWRQRIPTMFPFAYPPLVDLILRVRTADKVNNGFVAHLLKRTHKGLAAFPDSNTGVRIGASRLRRELVHAIDFATNRLFRPKARSDHQDFADWLARMRPGLEPLFEDLQAATGAFDMDHVRTLTRRCRAGDDPASRTLQFLWAWGIWRMNQTAVSGRR